MESNESKATVVIDVFREATRNLIALVVVVGGGSMLYSFVQQTPVDDKQAIMNLVVGLIGGYIAGCLTWFFGGAMKSGLAQLKQTQEGKIEGGGTQPPPGPVG